MNINEQVRQQLRLKENHEVEYKSAKGGFPASFWETFSAFANTNGGTIVLGVKEKDGVFTPDGLTKDQIGKYRKQFWDDAHKPTNVNVPLLLEDDVKDLTTDSGKLLLVFHIPRAYYDLRPIHLTLTPFGHTYKRKHEGDYLCSDDEVRQMYSDANNMKYSADSRILHGYTIDDIDLPTLHQYRRSYNNRHENHPWTEVDDMRFLENIGAYRKDRKASEEGFTVAGLLMFGKSASITDPECCQQFWPDYRERLSLEPGIRWTNRVYPDGTWEANLYQFFTRVLPMLQHALPVPFRLDENQRRIDTTTAHTALREAFGNCLIHCAYTVMGNITIDRYFDRIVMSNPGTMLISLDEFYEGGHSICRNPVLQKMFIFIGVGEKGGSGADVIAKGWSDNGWQTPTLSEHSHPDRTETVLPLPERLVENNEKLVESDGKLVENGEKLVENNEKLVENDGKLVEMVIENAEKVIEKVIENAAGHSVKVTENRIAIIREMICHPNISKVELAQILGLSTTAIDKNIAAMRDKLIRRIGPDKGGRWEIIID